MKKKYSELLRFTTEARAYRNGEKIAKTKLEYALDKMLFRIVAACKNLETEMREKVLDARVECASLDENKNLIIQPDGNYANTTKKRIELEERVREILKKCNDTDVEIEPFLAKEIPALTEFQVAAFKGFVIPENYEIREP